MFSVKEFLEKKDFGSLLEEYQDAIIKKMGRMGQMAGEQLVRQLKRKSNRVIGLIDDESNLPVAFAFIRNEGEDQSKGFIDLVFLGHNYQTNEVSKELLKHSIKGLIAAGAKIINFSSPSFTDFSYETSLLELGFKKETRYKVRFDVLEFKQLETSLPDQYKLIPWDNKYRREIAELIVKSYQSLPDGGQFAEYQTVDEYENKIKFFETNPRQNIIKNASTICLDVSTNTVVGFDIIVPLSPTQTLMWEMHIKQGHRGRVISKPLIEKSLNSLIMLGYSQTFFSTSYKRVAEHATQLFPGKCEIVGEIPVFYYVA